MTGKRLEPRQSHGRATVLATTLRCMTLDENKKMANRVVLMIKVNLEGRKLILASLAKPAPSVLQTGGTKTSGQGRP